MAFQSCFDFRMPTRVLHGAGSICRLPQLLPDNARPLIVTDAGLVEAGVVDMLTSVLDDGGIKGTLFTDVVGNPVARNVAAGARVYAKAKCDAIIGLGGGSPMDVAKMVGVIATNGGRIDSYLGAGKVKVDLPPLICLPTTYGTASEVTPFAVLTNPRTQNKDPVISWKIAPVAAILDPNLSVALPVALGGTTGMDALTHAIECFINLLATPVTESLALGAIEMIGDNLRVACANDFETEATQAMLLASCMAGVAFSQTRLGNVHAMSHPVGAQFGVHHGLANAVLLPHVMGYNLPTRLSKFARIAAALGEQVDDLSAVDAAWSAVDAVRQLNEDLGIPGGLKQIGVKASGINKLANTAMLSGNVEVNPRKTTLTDMRALFHTAM